MANENYLYSFPKSEIESQLNTLEGYRNDSGNTYKAAFMNTSTNKTTKKVTTQEMVDPRTRLAVMENKEAIEELTNRLSNLNIPSNDGPKYVPAGKMFVKMGASSVSCYGNTAQGNGYSVYINNGITYTRDGETFKTIYCEPETEEGITLVGFEKEYRMLRYAQVAFADNAFFFYCGWIDSPIVIYTTDFQTFTKVDLDNISGGLLLQDENDAKLIAQGKAYSITTSGATLLGEPNIELKVQNMDNNEVIAKLNGYYYGISYSGNELYKSEDFVNFTKVSTPLDGNPARYAILNGSSNSKILVVSNKFDMVYTTDGENWSHVAKPTFIDKNANLVEYEESEEEQNVDIMGNDPLNIHELNGAYYAILRSTRSAYYSGIFKWTSLDSKPEYIYVQSPDAAYKNILSFNEHNILKKVDDNLFFIYRGRIFVINNLGVFNIPESTIPNTDFSDLQYNAYYGSASLSMTSVFKIFDNLYFADASGTEGYRQITVYKPE